MSKHPGLDEATVQRLRQQVSNKGMEINQKLTELLAGQDVELADLDGLPLPTETTDKIEKLRAYLRQISDILKSFGTGTYGKCARCGAWISPTLLQETPWQSICSSCDEIE